MNIIQRQASLARSVGDEIRDLWQSAIYGGDKSAAAMLSYCGFDSYSKFAADTANLIRISATKDNGAIESDDESFSEALITENAERIAEYLVTSFEAGCTCYMGCVTIDDMISAVLSRVPDHVNKLYYSNDK